MNMSDFVKIIEEKKKINPFWFDDESELIAENDHIVAVENQLGLMLPEKYKDFVKKFGGGYFAFTNIFSVDSSGEWFIVDRNDAARKYLPNNFIAVSDDEAGGMYGFVAEDGVCGEEIFYWDNDSSSISEKMFDDLLDYLIEVGLKN